MPLELLKMKKVVFYVSEKVLLGEVACKYCYKTKMQGFEALQTHFQSECKVKLAHPKNCECFFCDIDIEVFQNDGHNLYLNKNTFNRYFEMGPFQFWSIVTPHYILKDEDGVFTYEEKNPTCAA